MTITPTTRTKRAWLISAVAAIFAATASCALAQDGRLEFEPVTGIVGTPVVASASGLTPGQTYDLVWSSAAASWNVADGEFYGITSEDVSSVLGQLTADASGNAATTFVVPEDYGYVHNVFVEQGGVRAARQGFVVAPSLTISPTSGPPGTPITLTLTGVGYRLSSIGRCNTVLLE